MLSCFDPLVFLNHLADPSLASLVYLSNTTGPSDGDSQFRLSRLWGFLFKNLFVQRSVRSGRSPSQVTYNVINISPFGHLLAVLPCAVVASSVDKASGGSLVMCLHARKRTSMACCCACAHHGSFQRAHVCTVFGAV